MFVYILSTGRTGTNYLSYNLNKVFPGLEITHQQIGSRIINIVANLPMSNSIYLSCLESLFKFFNRGIPPYSTIDPLLSMAIYKLIKYNRLDLKKCLIIHLVRSPGNFITSFMNWKKQSFKRTVLHHIVPFWNPMPLFHGHHFYSWLKMSKFEQFCWVWSYKNYCYSELKNGKYLLIKMEELLELTTQRKILDELAKFLEKDALDVEMSLNKKKHTNRSNPKKFIPFAKWTTKQKQIMHSHCDELMTKMKYV